MNNNSDYQAGSRGESMQPGGDLTAWRAGQEALQRQRDEDVAQSQRNWTAFNELMAGTSKLHDFTPTYVSSTSSPAPGSAISSTKEPAPSLLTPEQEAQLEARWAAEDAVRKKTIAAIAGILCGGVLLAGTIFIAYTMYKNIEKEKRHTEYSAIETEMLRKENLLRPKAEREMDKLIDNSGVALKVSQEFLDYISGDPGKLDIFKGYLFFGQRMNTWGLYVREESLKDPERFSHKVMFERLSNTDAQTVINFSFSEGALFYKATIASNRYIEHKANWKPLQDSESLCASFNVTVQYNPNSEFALRIPQRGPYKQTICYNFSP